MLYTWNDLYNDVVSKASNIAGLLKTGTIETVYGVPRGGIPVAIAISYCYGIPIAESPDAKTLIVDDFIDTCETMKKYPIENYRFVLVATTYKKDGDIMRKLITEPRIADEPVFPWEHSGKQMEEGFEIIYRACGEERELDKKKMAKTWEGLLDGYGDEPKIRYVETSTKKTMEIKSEGFIVDEDNFIVKSYNITATVEPKPKKLPNLDDVGLRLKYLSHRLITPHDFADSVYKHFNKIFRKADIEVEIEGVKYVYKEAK